jgi:hypothetical protein
MTIEELENNHLHVPYNHNYSRKEHAKISLQYAISVLEDYRESIIQYMIGHTDKDGAFVTPKNAREVWNKTKWDLGLQAKITELQSLIK